MLSGLARDLLYLWVGTAHGLAAESTLVQFTEDREGLGWGMTGPIRGKLGPGENAGKHLQERMPSGLLAHD